MHKLSTADIAERIKDGALFEAESADAGFHIKIERYSPALCLAIHSGSRLRAALEKHCAIDAQGRWYEEDPLTDTFISSMPLVISGIDSRYEYDLNRRPEHAVYDIAWGRQVWHGELPEEEKQKSLQKHALFYNVLNVLISELERRFGACLVFDMHSYNHKRWMRQVPLFNLGTAKVDVDRYAHTLAHWEKELSKIKLPNVQNRTARNDVFQGMGYVAEYVQENFSHTLVLPTEVKKVYCDEETGEIYPLVANLLHAHLKKAILSTSAYFVKKHVATGRMSKTGHLSSELDDAVVAVDKALYRLTRNFEILNHVNPINLESEKKRFFNGKYRSNPAFRYRQLAIDPFSFKRELYRVPVESIRDINIQMLYKGIMNAYADKVDMISTIGQDKFLYNSLRYFGEPQPSDIDNAEFLMSCPPDPLQSPGVTYTDQQTRKLMEEATARYGFSCKIEVVPNMVSKALVLNSRKTVRIKKGATFTQHAVDALIHHEIGVHMVTTINATMQPLQFPRIGLPVNTRTQEGLAVLSEYLSGNLTIDRLRELALRVLAIRNMLKGHDFKRVFAFLLEEGQMTPDQAFYLSARIFRGGGFTKDYLYLSGFRDVLFMHLNGGGFENLLIGKTSLMFLSTINEMVERKMLLPPKFKPAAYTKPMEATPILQYVMSGLRQ
jgi:uncharacterized protein (TIGR02421 family)